MNACGSQDEAPTPSQPSQLETPDTAIELASAVDQGAVPARPDLGTAIGDADARLQSTPDVMPDDIRSPTYVPAGTSDENAEAFRAMRKSKRDSAPVGGIGPSGIHIDDLVVGRGFTKSRCETETGEFNVEEDDRANLCIRVVHGGAVDEQLTVKWTREGRGPKVTRLSLHNGHAYRTRAWLPVRHYSAGDWTVTVTASDGTVLGQADFVVSK
jgi:hypothetical protein